MTKKKIILLLNDNSEKSKELIAFVEGRFSNCIVEAAFVTIPKNLRKGSLGGYINSFVDQGERGSHEKNIYKIFPNSILDRDLFLRISRYYDFLVSTKSIYAEIVEQYENPLESHQPDVPLLLLPDVNFRPTENVIFVNNANTETMLTFKKFFYLFNNLCSTAEVILLQLYGSNSTEEDDSTYLSERKLFEYISAKCKHFSIHKVVGELSESDLRAVNFSESSLLVFNSTAEVFNSETIGKVLFTNNNISFSTAG